MAVASVAGVGWPRRPMCCLTWFSSITRWPWAPEKPREGAVAQWAKHCCNRKPLSVHQPRAHCTRYVLKRTSVKYLDFFSERPLIAMPAVQTSTGSLAMVSTSASLRLRESNHWARQAAAACSRWLSIAFLTRAACHICCVDAQTQPTFNGGSYDCQRTMSVSIASMTTA